MARTPKRAKERRILADHLDEPGLMSPGGDPSIDITDIYAFKKAGVDKSILVMAVNPLTISAAFNHRALYQLAIDTNGDARADIAFNITFSRPHSEQRVVVRRATGDDARENEVEGRRIISGGTNTVVSRDGYKLFAGRRSDAFFFDLAWFLAGLPLPHTTIADFFAMANVDAIVLEVPNSALGESPNVGIWGRTLLPEDDDGDDGDDDDDDHDDDFAQIERMGRPAINTVFMAGARKRQFNRSKPQNDRAEFTGDVVGVLTTLGGALGGASYDAATAATIAGILLPDILTYNYTSPGGFLNGRRLDDDVIDIELGLVTNTARTTDGVGAHGDLLANFPFLGPPH